MFRIRSWTSFLVHPIDLQSRINIFIHFLLDTNSIIEDLSVCTKKDKITDKATRFFITDHS